MMVRYCLRLMRGFGLTSTCVLENSSAGQVQISASPSKINSGCHDFNWFRTYKLYAPRLGSSKFNYELYAYQNKRQSSYHPVKQFDIDITQRRQFSSSQNLFSQEKQQKKEEASLDVSDKIDEASLSIFQRFKLAYKQHGKTLIGVHVATSVVWLGSFYYIALSGFDIVGWLRYIGLSETIITPFTHKGLGEIAVAYLMYKLATPARYTVTLGGTNIAIRYFKTTGYIKRVDKEDSLRELYKESKSKLKTKRDDITDDIKDKLSR